MRRKSSKSISPLPKGSTTLSLSERIAYKRSMLSRVGFRVRTSRIPESGEVSTRELKAICGRLIYGLYGRYDRDTSSWRTLLPSRIGASGRCLAAFTKRGMTRSGRVFRLWTSVSRTKENGYSLWPTPIAFDASRARLDPGYLAARRRKMRETKRGGCSEIMTVAADEFGKLPNSYLSLFLMGFPKNWLDCEPVAMPSCPKSLSLSDEESSRGNNLVNQQTRGNMAKTASQFDHWVAIKRQRPIGICSECDHEKELRQREPEPLCGACLEKLRRVEAKKNDPAAAQKDTKKRDKKIRSEMNKVLNVVDALDGLVANEHLKLLSGIAKLYLKPIIAWSDGDGHGHDEIERDRDPEPAADGREKAANGKAQASAAGSGIESNVEL